MATIDEILVSVSPGETRVASLAAGRLIDLAVERLADEALGAIHRGRVVRVDAALDAAFVDIGRARPGFLPAEAARHAVQPPASRGTPIAGLLSEGETVLVQAVRPEIGDKGVGLTTDIAVPGVLGVLMPRSGEIAVSRRIEQRAERARLKAEVGAVIGGLGAIVRSAAAGAPAERLTQEFERLRRVWRDIESGSAPALLLRPVGAAVQALIEAPARPRIRVDDRAALTALAGQVALWRPDLADRVTLHADPAPLFERHDIESQIAAALMPRVDLAGGGAIAIETTEALTAIDVNAGGSARAAVEVNGAAAREIARQLRLRSIGGLVLIDFLRVHGREARERLLAAFRAALADDRVPVQVIGWTRAGLVELTRPRDRAPLATLMTDAGPARVAGAAASAHAALRTVLATARRRPAGRYVLLAAPAMVAYLQGEGRGALEAANGLLGGGLVLKADFARANEAFEILPDTR
jgi:ribonuclease G